MDGTQGMECDHAPKPADGSQSVGNAPPESPVNSPTESPMDSTYESDDEYENATRNEDGGMLKNQMNNDVYAFNFYSLHDRSDYVDQKPRTVNF
nr:hypothetical protein Iba_chr01fCG3170 [Ipomoea batatas]